MGEKEGEMKKAYIIVQQHTGGGWVGDTIASLERQVNSLISIGYVPLGSPFSFDGVYVQAMVTKEIK